MNLLHRITVFLFSLVYISSRWTDRRFTASGKFVLSVLVISAALGVDTRLNLAHQVFTLLSSLILISLLWAPFFRFRYSFRRSLPRFGTVDQPMVYRVSLLNEQRASQRGLEWAEDFTADRAVSLLSADRDEVIRTNWFDRLIGYPRWASRMRRASGALDVQQPVGNISANSSTEFEVTVKPLRRGYLNFSRCSLTATDPLGLFRARVNHSETGRVLILPKRYRLPVIDLPGSRRYQQGGVSLASEIGESDEFVSLRDYRPGDPLRHVHWKSLARTGKPVVKQYQDEYFSRHALILDNFSHEDNRIVFEAAVSVAASFASTVDTSESLLDLLFVAQQPVTVTIGRSLGRADQLLQTLACVEPSIEHDFKILNESVMAHSHRVSGCICVLLEWDHARQKLLQQLIAVGVPCMVLLVTEQVDMQTLDIGPMDAYAHRFHVIRPSSIEQDLATL